MNDKAIATTRTAINTGIFFAALTLIAKAKGWTLTDEHFAVIVPAATVAMAIFYRLSLELAERFPTFGYVLFGIPKSPSYIIEQSDI